MPWRGNDTDILAFVQVKRFVSFKRMKIALVRRLEDGETNDMPLGLLEEVHVPDVVIMAVGGNAVCDVVGQDVLASKCWKYSSSLTS